MTSRLVLSTLAACALGGGLWLSGSAGTAAASKGTRDSGQAHGGFQRHGVPHDLASALFWRGGPGGRFQVLLYGDNPRGGVVRPAFACWSPQSARPSRLLSKVLFPRTRWLQVRGADLRQPDYVFRVRGRGIGGPASMHGRLAHIPRGDRAPIQRITGAFRSAGCNGGRPIRYRITGSCVPAFGDGPCGFTPPRQLVLRVSLAWGCASAGRPAGPRETCPLQEAIEFRVRPTTTPPDAVQELRFDFGGSGFELEDEFDPSPRSVPDGVVVKRVPDPETGWDIYFMHRSPGTYLVRISVTTRRGLTTTLERTVEVVETAPPEG